MFTSQDQGRGAATRGLVRSRGRTMARRLGHAAVGVLCAAAGLLPVLFAGAPAAQADSFTTTLALEHGWTSGPSGTSPGISAEYVDGVVHFRGAITTSGDNPVAFSLPPNLTPAFNVFVPVNMCNGTTGRLDIYPSGDVQVEAEAGNWSNAQCGTSLDGASFVLALWAPNPPGSAIPGPSTT